MLELIHLIGFRSLSGLQNGLGYRKTLGWMTAVTVFMIINAASLGFLAELRVFGWMKYLSIAMCLTSIVGAIFVDQSFRVRNNPDKYNAKIYDIHLWENSATMGVVFAWMAMDANLIQVVCSVYPGMILHKGLINIGAFWRKAGGLSAAMKYFFYEGTDDPTGNTYTIPWFKDKPWPLNKLYKIRRLNNEWRISFAIASIVVALVSHLLKWRISITQIMDLF